MERHREKLKHAELIGGIIAAAIANFSGHVKDALVPAAFMPKYSDERPARAPRLNRRKVADQVRSFFRERIKHQGAHHG